MSNFFIDRPIFAWVLAIITMLVGILSLSKLPVEMYPRVAPPTVAISAFYPGASAEVVENSVTQIIEQRLTGIDNLRYFSSSSSDGAMTITLTFEPVADPDIAQVQTQNKVQGALSLLPPDVQSLGVTVTKSNDNFLLVAGFYSEDGAVSQQELGDLLVSKVQDPISRLNGVGNVIVFGDQNAMRIWLDPAKLVSYNMTATDVRAAVQVQNVDVTAGQLGGMPAAPGQQINATITAQSRLQTVDQFNNIILRVNTDGSQVRLKDVARIEIGSQAYDMQVRYKGLPASGIAVSMATGANALNTADLVKQRIAELQEVLPSNIKVVYPYDTTPFVKLSIESVIHTILEAVVLVFLVMLLFLQNIRATLIPFVAIPVVLLGTLAVLAAFGFSINMLTMFAMVLSIGLLVDDAIVVVENVERIMHEEGLDPKEATRKSMGQISSALIGISVILAAVLAPMAFFGGSAGEIYKQFSVTIITSMALSVLVALILSPSLCAALLKKSKKGHSEAQTGFFGWFNRHFNKTRSGFQKSSEYITHRVFRFFVIYLALGVVMALLIARLPTAFLPDEDQGMMFVMVMTPAGATAERTLESVEQVEQYLLNGEKDNVEDLFTVIGFSFAGNAQNAAMGFVGLKDWDERKSDDQSVFSIAGRSMGAFMQIKDAMAFAFFPPPIQELGNASGFDFQLVDRGGQGHDALMQARNMVLGMAAQNPLLAGVRPNGLDDVPQYKIDVDNEKAAALGINIADINQTLQIAWGSNYVNDFIEEGRIKRVYIQADAPFRMLPEDINQWYVRNANGQMIPFSAFATTNWEFGSPKLERFSGVASVNIQGAPAPGVSSGVAMAEIEKIVAQLPPGFAIEWSGLSYEERLSGSQAPMLYTISIIIVFLCLAALYESWSIPLAVIMVVPLGILGAALASYLNGLANDVYFQVALLTTIGLASRNAILIVEFAKTLHKQGHDIYEAATIAAKQRFRPIVMTSLAFTLGVTPLALASGAGSAAMNAIGIAVIGGMLASTFLALFFVPMFYVAVENLFARNKKTQAPQQNDDEAFL